MFELKESDLPELEQLAANGARWIAEDADGEQVSSSRELERGNECWYSWGYSIPVENRISGISWSDPEPLNIAAAIAQIKAQKIDGDSNEKCPICEYKISGCQCRYGGSAHPDRNDKRRVVFDHLHLLSLTQLQHVISLEKYWQISYSDADLNAILKRLIANSQCEGGERE